MLVYSAMNKAVEVLKRDFIENVDFQPLRRIPERGSASPIEYKLTVSCLEYLIDLNATQAAIRAGYSLKTAKEQAARLLSNVNIQKKISELKCNHGLHYKKYKVSTRVNLKDVKVLSRVKELQNLCLVNV